MLVVYGNIYSDNEEHFKEITDVLTEQEYVIGYNSQYNAVVLKNVVTEETNE